MHYNNNALLIKRNLLVSLIKLFFEDKLEDGIDRIPYQMTSDPNYQPIRCCVFHDRVILKIRILARLGFSVEDYEDDGTALALHAKKALERTAISGPVLTVLDEACNACVKAQFLITNACQGCLARPCLLNCPKKAVSMNEGHAGIDKTKCINCGICQQVCPYHAIIKIPVPCEEACPVGAISKNEAGKERIDYNKCIFCGNCMRECPFGAMMDKSQILDVLMAKKRGKKISALFAPAVAGQFRASIGKLLGALKQAGFDEVYEVALGADITAKNEALEFTERMEKGEPFMTTSCCPAYIETVQKHIPDLKSRVSETRTPIHYTAEIAAREHPDHLRVFIGPCLAKRKEGLDDPLVDYVLTAEELGALFLALGIDVAQAEEAPVLRPAKAGGRGFPLSGGVAEAVRRNLPGDANFHPEYVNGLNKEGIALMKAWSEGRNTGNILEVMACPGGCVAGPMVYANPKTATNQLKKIAEESEG
ncbi:Fe-hydrogenase large subunit family protein [Treponema primitia ZAS-2]|uniref:Fe-hydrogenase large subunit family protein n=1 Tax=Treponema primitia (strain ATCC BAA-887 / DSM 12427 / ZAS-2) TaxID=545694 RepID=F5YMB2_TREPZ|nr:monomeric [FeFe] hydrogenase [Treponema primitia]AEF84748.1 Fe-hydrogenase large subunit family protein [Treponema primitia ZAS-2]AEL20840.1 HydA5 [Treponema primitia ZAS-2]